MTKEIIHKNREWIGIMMRLNSHLTTVTLNVHGLNDPIKRNRVSDPSICCLQETHFRHKDTYNLKIKGWRTIYHSNGPQKKAGVAILISDKLKFITKTVVRDEEGHYIILKVSIQQEDLTIMNIYALMWSCQVYQSISNQSKDILR